MLLLDLLMSVSVLRVLFALSCTLETSKGPLLSEEPNSEEEDRSKQPTNKTIHLSSIHSHWFAYPNRERQHLHY